jgi:tRNA pseudouridine55 synthase
VSDGFILLAKPAGLTSFQALGSLKRSLETGKIGHTGTLDKFADGLLIALCGKLTRLCPYTMGLRKEYLARITFGTETDTLDPEGRVIKKGPIPAKDDIEKSLAGFLGEIEQVPPNYSAVHVDGRRAYQVARRGDPLIMSARTVTIHSLELRRYDEPEAEMRITCSSGTYIRSLARDIAAALGTCAFLTRLSRVRIGGFTLEEAVPPSEFDPAKHLLSSSTFFSRCTDLGRLEAQPGWERKIAMGVPLSFASFESPPEKRGIYGVFSVEDKLLALVEKGDVGLRYAAVLMEGDP